MKSRKNRLERLKPDYKSVTRRSALFRFFTEWEHDAPKRFVKHIGADISYICTERETGYLIVTPHLAALTFL